MCILRGAHKHSNYDIKSAQCELKLGGQSGHGGFSLPFQYISIENISTVYHRTGAAGDDN